MTGSGWFSHGGYDDRYPDHPLDAELIGDTIPTALPQPADPTRLDALELACRLAASDEPTGRRHRIGKALTLIRDPDTRGATT